jgi:predicted nucleic acid-binding protein
MPEKRRNLLDSSALIAFLGGERAGAAVRDLLRAADGAGDRLLMNDVNIGEVYYVVAKRRSPAAAEAFLRALETMPIEVVSNVFADVIEAAKLKAQHAISYADAVAAATAIRHGAVLVTGDPEFRTLEGTVTINWI